MLMPSQPDSTNPDAQAAEQQFYNGPEAVSHLSFSELSGISHSFDRHVSSAPSDAASVQGNSDQIAAWLEAVRSQEPGAFDHLINTYRTYLLALAKRALPDQLKHKVDASDLVQDACLRAHQRIEEFNGTTEAAFLGWLKTILTNYTLDVIRKFNTGKRRVSREQSMTADASGYNFDIPTTDESPLSYIEREEEGRILAIALELLPREEQEVIIMRHMHGMTFQAIGVLIGKSADTVRRLWARAIEQLHEEIQRIYARQSRT